MNGQRGSILNIGLSTRNRSNDSTYIPLNILFEGGKSYAYGNQTTLSLKR